MSLTLRLRVLEAEVDVECPEGIADTVRKQWSHCLSTDPTSPAFTTVDLTDEPEIPGESAESWRHRLEYAIATRVTYAAIAHQTGQRLMLHAAALADPGSGRVAILVAESGTGKTTAAQRLGHAGLLYLTDETVALDAAHDVLPYPKPLSVVIDPADPYDKSQHGPDELGMAVADQGGRVARLLLLDRDRSAPREPALTEVTLIDAILTLIPQTSALPALEHPLRRLLELIEVCGGVFRLSYHEITDALPLLRESLATSAPRAPEVRLHEPTDEMPDRYTVVDALEQDAPLDLNALLIRGPFSEALEYDGEVIVLVGSSPVRLRGLGATLWLSSRTPRRLRDLVQDCITAYGDPGNAEELVAQAADQLVAYGVLREV